MKKIEICPSCGLEVVTESGRPSRCPRCESPVGDGRAESDALLSLEFDGEAQGASSYPLPEGVSTIGRRSARSTATVQIAVTDGFMSKVHCRVTAQRRGDVERRADMQPDFLSVGAAVEVSQRKEPLAGRGSAASRRRYRQNGEHRTTDRVPVTSYQSSL